MNHCCPIKKSSTFPCGKQTQNPTIMHTNKHTHTSTHRLHMHTHTWTRTDMDAACTCTNMTRPMIQSRRFPLPHLFVIHTGLTKHASEYPCQYRKTHRHGCRMHMCHITPSHTCSHTLPPPLPWTHTSSHPRSLSHPSDVSWSKMPAGSTLIALPPSWRSLGTRRGGSQPSHSPPAHARCVHQHAHACSPCTCAMHMHVCSVALSLSAYARTVHACVHVHAPPVMHTTYKCDTCT
jgi:hypothetical protein